MRNILCIMLAVLMLSTCFSAEKKVDNYKLGTKALSAYFKSGKEVDFKMAVLKFNQVLRENPENAAAKISLGMLHNKKSQNLANQLQSKEIKKKSLYFSLGNLLMMQGRFNEAISAFETATKHYPNWTCAFRHKGEALFKAGLLDEAISSLEKSIELKVDHFDAYVFLAEALIEAKQYTKAETALDNAVKYSKTGGCNPDHEEAGMSDVNKLYIRLYEKTGEKEKLARFRNEATPVPE